MAVGTYEHTNREMLVFAGHAEGQRKIHSKKIKEALVVGALVSQLEICTLICGNFYKMICMRNSCDILTFV
jgi:hypothetical protein